MAQTDGSVDALRPDEQGGGRRWETGKRTIQAAINVASTGGTVSCRYGNENVSVVWPFDLAGQPRIQGSAVERGAFESVPIRRGIFLQIR